MSSGSAPKSANGSRSRAPLRDVTDVANSIAGSTSWLQETSSRVFKWVSENPAPAAGAVAGVVGAALVAAYFSKPSSGEQKERPTASPMRQGAAGRSGRLALLQLDEYERSIRKDIILPHQIEEGFADIGGLEDIIERVEDLVILPLTKPHLFSQSKLANRPTGVLLYGPPGTGKTLLAKAIAKECGASFINVNLATIMSKYVGDSEKMVQAVFSLANKLSPCIIFVDEMDGFLSRRSEGSNDPAVTDKVKTLFMALWDGIASASSRATAHQGEDAEKAWVLVIGATNRPHALDTAILRRMPRQIQVGLPSAPGRRKILQVLLKGESVAPSGPGASQLDLGAVAAATNQYSGSDLKELCRAAALRPIREASIAERSAVRAARQEVESEFARKMQERSDWECGMAPPAAASSPPPSGAQPDGTSGGSATSPTTGPTPMSETEARAWREAALETAQQHAANTVHMRPIVTADLIAAMAEVKQTGLSAYEYQQTLAAAQTGLGDGSVPVFAPAGAAFGGGLEGNSARLLGALQQQTQKGD